MLALMHSLLVCQFSGIHSTIADHIRQDPPVVQRAVSLLQTIHFIYTNLDDITYLEVVASRKRSKLSWITIMMFSDRNSNNSDDQCSTSLKGSSAMGL